MGTFQNIDGFLDQFIARAQRVQARLGPRVGAEVVSHSMDNFRTESFDGQKWPGRKDKKNNRQLLIKSGNLRRSVRIVSIALTSVIVGSDMPYARIHNDGGTIHRAARTETFVRNRHKTGKKGKMFGGMGAFQKGTAPGRGQTYRSYTINMPRRRFLGFDKKIKTRIRSIIDEEIKKEFA